MSQSIINVNVNQQSISDLQQVCFWLQRVIKNKKKSLFLLIPKHLPSVPVSQLSCLLQFLEAETTLVPQVLQDHELDRDLSLGLLCRVPKSEHNQHILCISQW